MKTESMTKKVSYELTENEMAALAGGASLPKTPVHMTGIEDEETPL